MLAVHDPYTWTTMLLIPAVIVAFVAFVRVAHYWYFTRVLGVDEEVEREARRRVIARELEREQKRRERQREHFEEAVERRVAEIEGRAEAEK